MTIPDRPTSPAGSTPDLSDFDDFDDQLGSINENRQFHEDLKQRLGPRTVRQVNPTQTLKKGHSILEMPGHQNKLSLRTLRAVGALFGGMSAEKDVEIKPVNRWDDVTVPATEWDKDFYKNKVDIFVSDSELAKKRTGNDQFFYREEYKKLSTDGHFRVSDIAQIDANSTCYLLSSLGAYAASPLGQRILSDSLHEFKEGFVACKMWDATVEQDIQVLVSNQRLLDEEGKDLYSCNNSSGARWAGMYEKAYDAYLMNRLDALTEMASEAAGDQKEYINSLVRNITGSEKSGKQLDYSDLSRVMQLLPGLPDLVSPDKKYRQSALKSVISLKGNSLEEDKNKALIKYNIEQGVPVIVGTKEGFRGALNATSGTPTGHAVAVVCPAQTMVKNKMVEGFLVYDPYGEALGEQEIPDFATLNAEKSAAEAFEEGNDWESLEAREIITLKLKSAGQALSFCSYDSLSTTFERAIIARGGFERDPNPEPEDWEFVDSDE